MHATVWTVGHSNRSLDDLMGVLEGAGIHMLVDVRAYPGSRRHPQFDRKRLREGARARGITYYWAGRRLGGKRAQRSNSPHIALEEPGLRAYADHMATTAFRQGASRLKRLACHVRIAVLCAEKWPEHCHRSLLSDYLTVNDVQVIHQIESDHSRAHHLSQGLRHQAGELIYDGGISRELDLH